MKYTAILVSLVAGAVAVPQGASTITSAPASAASVALTPQQSCAVYSCAAGDVTCQASCLGIARPNSSQAVETNECAAKCDQGDGSPAATQKFTQCVQACIASFFPSSQTVAAAPNASGSAATNAASATGALASATGSAASHAASGTAAHSTGASTASGSAASSTPSGAASANNAQLAGAGLVGLALAMFAL